MSEANPLFERVYLWLFKSQYLLRIARAVLLCVGEGGSLNAIGVSPRIGQEG